MEELDLVFSVHQENCSKSVSVFKKDLQKIRSGRASASMLEGVMVDYYGSRTPLAHLGQISSPEPRMLSMQVYDQSAVESCEKAIRSADLGLNPSREGNQLRIMIPPLTQETRKDIVKRLNKMAEDIRISIRNHRRDANEELKELEKGGSLNKDEAKKAQEKTQKITDEAIKQVDVLLKEKEAECMEV